MEWYQAARRHPIGVAAALAAVGALPIVALGLWAWWTAASVDLSRLHPDSPTLYAAGRPVRAGLSVEAGDLAGSLQRLGYEETSAAPSRPGQFRRGGRTW